MLFQFSDQIIRGLSEKKMSYRTLVLDWENFNASVVTGCILAQLLFGNPKAIFREKHSNVGVARGVTTREAQIVWLMMIDTVTNLL